MRLAAVTAMVTVLSPSAWAGAAAPNGTYVSDGLGVLEVSNTSGGRISGKYVDGGQCVFEPRQQLLEGRMEGDALVGTLLLCQTGPACESRAYPVMAFYDADANSLTLDVRLDPGCSSPALVGRRLVLVAGRAAGQGRKPTPEKNLALAQQALLEGARLAEARDFAGAVRKLERSISLDDSNWAAYLNLGAAEFQRGNVYRAIELYERARELARQARQEDGWIAYNLACAYSRLGDRRAALSHLRQALKQGFSEAAAMARDADLNALFRDDPEFRRLLQQAWAAKRGEKP